MQHQIAYVATQIEAARMLIYNAARRQEAGLPIVKEGAMAKFYSSEVTVMTSAIIFRIRKKSILSLFNRYYN